MAAEGLAGSARWGRRVLLRAHALIFAADAHLGRNAPWTNASRSALRNARERRADRMDAVDPAVRVRSQRHASPTGPANVLPRARNSSAEMMAAAGPAGNVWLIRRARPPVHVSVRFCVLARPAVTMAAVARAGNAISWRSAWAGAASGGALLNARTRPAGTMDAEAPAESVRTVRCARSSAATTLSRKGRPASGHLLPVNQGPNVISTPATPTRFAIRINWQDLIVARGSVAVRRARHAGPATPPIRTGTASLT
jgi:hypothetical protein